MREKREQTQKPKALQLLTSGVLAIILHYCYKEISMLAMTTHKELPWTTEFHPITFKRSNTIAKAGSKSIHRTVQIHGQNERMVLCILLY